MVAIVLACLVPGSAGAGGRLEVVAAENVWGSIAEQLGGDRVHVTSVVSNPAADPHDYEPTAFDARTFAGAIVAIVNGAGYDPWASRLIAANPKQGRVVLDVGHLVGVGAGGNPHRWYSPPDVRRVIDAIATAYRGLDPRDGGYFERQRVRLETEGLGRYHRLIATIRARFRNVPVGASESIFEPLAQALGLRLVTPPSFLNAIGEGTEPTAADRSTIDRQIRRRQIRVWVDNSQNSTPDVKRLTDEVRAHGIPVVTITETLTPASATFQAWQSSQLAALLAALARATHR